MPSRVLASAAQHRRLANARSVSLVPPWQALVMLVVLTVGAGVRAFPESIQPFALYAHGMLGAAKAWHQSPPANSPEYLGR